MDGDSRFGRSPSGANRSKSIMSRQFLEFVQGCLFRAVDRDGKSTERKPSLMCRRASYKPRVRLGCGRAVVDVDGGKHPPPDN